MLYYFISFKKTNKLVEFLLHRNQEFHYEGMTNQIEIVIPEDDLEIYQPFMKNKVSFFDTKHHTFGIV